MSIRFASLVAGVCCLSVASAQAMKAADVSSRSAREGFAVLAENGRVVADIVLPDNPLYAERFAAEELKHHLEKALGATVEVLAESNGVSSCRTSHIYLGHTRAAEKAGLLAKPLKSEERLLRTVGNDLYLLGNDSRIPQVHFNNFLKARSTGTLYAVYDFLENEMGVRWLWPGKTGEVIPKRATVRLGGIDRRGVEPLEVRGTYPWVVRFNEPVGFARAENDRKIVREETKFYLRHRFGRRSEFYEGHSFEKWWDKYGKDHPEYFNLLPNGSRMPVKAPSMVSMCVSEPGVWRQKVDDWYKEWKTYEGTYSLYPHYPFVNCCENDTVALCTCARCRAWDGPDPRFEKSDYWSGRMAADFDEKYVGKKNPPGLSAGARWMLSRKPADASQAASLSDRYVRFYNEVAAVAKTVHPEAKALGYAYVNYIEPPLKTRVGEDTVIIYVQRSFFPYDQEESEVFRQQWGGWYRMGAKRMVYRPNFMLSGANFPQDTARRALDDFAFAYTNGMFICTYDTITGAWSAQAMRLYATVRAMRDPLRGYEKARADMLEGFGAAAPAVNRYFDLVEAHSAKWTQEAYRQIGLKNILKSGDIGGGFRTGNAVLGEYFDDSFFTDCYACFDEAVRAARNDEEVVSRIEFLRKGVRETEIARRCRLAQKASEANPEDAEKRAAFEAVFKELTDYRASVEGDCVCNYGVHAQWERWFIGWPHKNRTGEKESKAKKPLAGE